MSVTKVNYDESRVAAFKTLLTKTNLFRKIYSSEK